MKATTLRGAYDPTIQLHADGEGHLITAGVRMQNVGSTASLHHFPPWEYPEQPTPGFPGVTTTSGTLVSYLEEDRVDLQQALTLTQRLIQAGVDPDHAVDAMIALLKGSK